MNKFTLRTAGLMGVALVFALSACSGIQGGKVRIPKSADQKGTMDQNRTVYEGDPERAGIFGSEGLNIFNNEKSATGAASSGGGIGVNSFLWRATLDTVAFMPVNSADPFGGVVITDWYAPPETPSERFKLNVYIIGTALRADGVKVSLFRQVAGAGGNWRDAQAEPGAGRKLEDAILTRARQLRNETRQQNN